jgi:hypothetical protein
VNNLSSQARRIITFSPLLPVFHHEKVKASLTTKRKKFT